MHWQHGQMVQGTPRIQNYQSTTSGASKTGLQTLSTLSCVRYSWLPTTKLWGHLSEPCSAGHSCCLQTTKGTGLRRPVHARRGNISFGTGLSSVGSPDIKYVSPKHRLIKVETIEKSNSAPGSCVIAAQAVAVGSVKSPTSPPSDQENKEKPIILWQEDYADPFDAEQAGGTQASTEKVTENDGYMEPYEAQKMMAEIRGGRGPKEGSARQPPLYDTPYEPVENGGGDSDPERPRCPRESRLPQDDDRPPEEYDQPWEWKKERISKAFAVQFDGVEKSRMSPTKEGKGRPAQRHTSGCLVNTKMNSLDPSALGERVDPAMPLESQFWYHGAISRTDAETLLRLCKEASYLVRNSETSKNDFSLSLKSSQGFMHMKLSRTKENKYILGQNSCPFDSVPEIIHFYSSRKLPIKGAEHMSLLYPVAIRTL
ncbi:SH2 domain-containing adapter protein F isoform X4 [Osmerus eperlanus]|uniref:SH2 domain-containing adapter protein F isoform X4 n=1 Tax=Osmerus eperlanus TaxID=29151 RepID=UPI002E161F37